MITGINNNGADISAEIMLVLFGCSSQTRLLKWKRCSYDGFAAALHAAAAAANLSVIVSEASPARLFPAVDLIKLSLFHKLS